jgi:signal transduction histidine kinase
VFEANPLALLPLLCCVVGVRTALVTYRLAPGLLLAAGGAVVWSACIAVAACLTEPGPAPWTARISLAATLGIGGGVLHFLTALARVPRRGLWLAIGMPACAAGALIALLDPAIFPTARPVPWGGYYSLAGPRIIVPVAILLGLMGFPMAYTLRTWRRTPPSRRRAQLGHVLAAFGIALLGTLDLAAVLGYDLPPVGWLTSIVSLTVLYRSIAHLRLVGARTAFSRTRFWALFLCLTFLPLLAVVELTEGWAGWGSLGTRVLALVALWTVGARVERLVASAFERPAAAAAARVRAFAAATRSPSTPAFVLPPLARALEGVGLELCAAALGVDVGDGPPAAWDVLVAGEEPRVEAPPAPLPGAIVAREDLEPGRADPWLDAFDADVAVPLRHRREVVGVVLARLRRGYLDEEAREALGRLAAQAAVAFTNAALHDRLARRAQHLQREVDERTRSLTQAISDRRAAQARLVQAERQSALGLLVAGVSHEVNNALNFIYANAPVLETYATAYDALLARAGGEAAARAAAGRLREGAGAVAEAARRTRALVEDLRRFARGDTERQPIDLREAARAAMKLARAHARLRSDVTWRIADAPEGAYIIDAYPAALHHALLALGLNAAQAAGEAGTIAVELAAAEGSVRLVVVDDGPGVPAEERERVFEPFVTTRSGATGLGLTTARATAQRLGGSLVLEGMNGRGTRAVLTLPARRP